MVLPVGAGDGEDGPWATRPLLLPFVGEVDLGSHRRTALRSHLEQCVGFRYARCRAHHVGTIDQPLKCGPIGSGNKGGPQFVGDRTLGIDGLVVADHQSEPARPKFLGQRQSRLGDAVHQRDALLRGAAHRVRNHSRATRRSSNGNTWVPMVCVFS